MPQEDGSIKIGVLALQGAFQAHFNSLSTSHLPLDLEVIYVRTKKELLSCDGLVIPGGESTVMSKLVERANLTSSLQDFVKTRPVFGTCAGLILLAKEIENNDKQVISLSALDIAVSRNGYGRQKDSFAASLECKLERKKTTISAPFIRAPKIVSVGKKVNILALHEGMPVLVQQGMALGATFHPELSEDREIHNYFISLVKEASRREAFNRPLIAV